MTALPGFVFVHGAWHNADTWHTVLPLLRARGFIAEALDLPGAGVYAQDPSCFRQQPADLAAMATEFSPNARVTQDERTAAVSAKVAEVAARANGQVVLVGHSLGGITISPVAEAHPAQLAAVVYLAALLLPPGVSPLAFNHEPELPAIPLQQRFEQLLVADPTVVGAGRVNWLSDDLAYKARLKAFFYPEADEETYRQFTARLHADEPASVLVVPSVVTPERFGSVPRYYIRTSEDWVTLLPTQDYMIARTDAVMPTPTVSYTLLSDHSPFAAQPQALVAVLAAIADQVCLK